MEDLPGLQAWEEQFTSLLNGAAITKFPFFNVNPNYFPF